MSEYILVGKIDKAHGIKGEVIVASHSDFPERFESDNIVYVSLRNGEKQELKIEKSRIHQDRYIIKFYNIDTRNDAEKLRGLTLEIQSEQLASLPEGEYWHHDIIGLDVYTENDEFLGTISEIMENPANDIYVVKIPDKKEILLPAIKDVILNIDLDNKKMKVKLIPGLI
ncbi:MAG: 16S rRNA processing protein RimM [Actinobacteria bacterium]|nr:16S rRNA processing protein RimM [Actinomycetota bacterium]